MHKINHSFPIQPQKLSGNFISTWRNTIANVLTIDVTATKFEKKRRTYLVFGALALLTAIVGSLYYFNKFSTNSSDVKQLVRSLDFRTTCPFPSILRGVSDKVADICSNASPYKYICERNLGYLRSSMPQVNSSTLSSYLSMKAAQGIEITKDSIDPLGLFPVQREMSTKAIFGMIHSWIQGTFDPCKDMILTASGYVIDGHHRWAACNLLQRPMTILNIHDTVNHVLSELSHFQGAFTLPFGQVYPGK